MAQDVAKFIEETNAKQDKLELAIQNQATGNQSERNEAEKARLTREFNTWARQEVSGREPVEFNAMSTDSDADGGYLVQPTYAGIIQGRVYESTPAMALATVGSGKGEWVVVVDEDEVGATRYGERQARADGDTPQLKEIRINPHDLEANQKVTNQMLLNSSVNLESWLAGKQADKFSRTIGTEFVSGSGVLEMRGITSYDAWTTNGTYEFNKIEQVNMGSASALTANGLISVQNSLKEAFQPNATWLMKRGTFGAVMKLTDGESNYLFNRALDQNTGVPFSLLGSKLRFADDMATVAANALSIAYGDFREGYTIVESPSVQMLKDPYTARPYIKFIAVKSIGGGVTNFDAIKIGKVAS